MAVPYTFGTATASIPLSQLDSNFATVITLGNTAIQLGNTVTTLNNMTLANVTISSGNVTLTNVTITTANVTTANVVTLIVTGNETVQGNTTVTGTITGAKFIPTGSSVTGNGMYLPAANSVGISTNGTNAVYIDSTQNVGIGTSSPTAKLDVTGTAAISGAVTLSGGTANGVTYLNGSKVLTSGSALTFNGSALAVNSLSPGVGINDTTATVGVSYSWLNGGASYAYGQIALRDTTLGQTAYSYVSGASGYHNWFQTGSEQMRLTSTGLGIGTSSPGMKLDVVGTIRSNGTAATTFNSFNSTGTTTGSNFLTLENTSGNARFGIEGSAGGVLATGTTAYATVVGSANGPAVQFIAGGSVGATLDSSGNLLVGVATANANGGVLQLKSGITFPATAVAATDANTLDDYEEGTWTPTQGSGLTVVGAFSSAGKYTKIGRQVYVSGQVAGATTVAAAASSEICGSLPFAASTANPEFYIGSATNSVYSLSSTCMAYNTSVYATEAITATPKIWFSATYTV